MKRTGFTLVAIAVALLVLEAFALKDPADDWWTITAVMRALPTWAISLVAFGSGVLFDHFYIREWNK